MDCIHSFENESVFKYNVHDYLNELLCTNPTYYKDASITLVLDTIYDKYCNIMRETDSEQPPPFTAQLEDDIEQAKEVIHKLGHVEDFPELSQEALAAITSMFSQLQLCHENCVKLAGHLAELGSLLQPDQFTYLMKHSLRPLVQISLLAWYCSPTDIKFYKLHLIPEETREEKGINLML